uniref:Phytocyanin domain-containing protein n=1 Tax=Leersia perrieri TaxID=77586 RepID=A0A0D9VCI3_9ORYZ
MAKGGGYIHGTLGLACFALVIAMAGATQFNVGGANGWSVPGANAESYNDWAEKTRFQVGDKLVFVYPKDKDSVLEVEPADYNSCNTASYDKKFADGSTAFDLDRAGAFFFISGVDDNCRAGEKLIVMVANSTTTTSSPPPSSSSSSPSGNNPPAGKPAGTANGGGGSKSGAAGITAATSGIAGVVVAAVAYVAAIAI